MTAGYQTGLVQGFVVGGLTVAVPVMMALRAAAARYTAEVARASMTVRMRELAVEALERVRGISAGVRP